MRSSIRIFGILSLIVILTITEGFPKAFNWEWAKTLNSRSTTVINALTADENGNSYITGEFTDSLIIGNQKLFTRGHSDIFIARIDQAGEPMWIRQCGGTESDEAYGIAVDPSGNVYVTGYISGKADFSGVILNSSLARDFFLAKYNKDGDLVWVKKQEGDNDDYGKSVCVDRNGNVYVSGVFHGKLVLGGKTVEPKGKLNVFIYKYTSTGDFLWGRTGEGEGSNQVAEINVDHSGNVYMGGTFEGKAGFDKKFIVSVGNKDVFLVKYNTDGVIQWLKRGGSAIGEDKLSSIAVDSSENIFISGSFSGTASFDKKQLKSKGSDDLFLVKYSKEGNVLWAVQSGGKGNEHSQAMELDHAGNIYIAGNFNSSFTFGSSKINSIGDWDVFVLKYAPDGKLLTGTQIGGKGYDKATGIALGRNGSLWLTGYFVHEVSFGKIILKSQDDKGAVFFALLKDL